METLECIKSRRSIRRFTEQKITDDILAKILEAVQWSPSWANTQCWEVVVVKDNNIKEKIAGLLSPKNPGIKGIIQAPLIMVMCGKKGVSGYKGDEPATDKGDWYMFDLGIASQNLCLAAHALGLGTVHIGSFDHKGVDKLLGLPAGVESIEIIPVGYPAKEGNPPFRKDLNTFVFIDKYGKLINRF